MDCCHVVGLGDYLGIGLVGPHVGAGDKSVLVLDSLLVSRFGLFAAGLLLHSRKNFVFKCLDALVHVSSGRLELLLWTSWRL